MVDLAVKVVMSVDGKAAITEMKAASAGLDGVKDSAKGATEELSNLGDESQKTAKDVSAVGGAADGAGSSAAGAAAGFSAAGGGLKGLGAAARTAGTDLLATAGAGQAAGGAMALLVTPVGLVVAAIAALTVGMAIAVSAADTFDTKMEEVSDAIARAGQSSQITADQFMLDSANIAASSGQAFGDVKAASLSLIETHKYSRETLEELTLAGADMAATFGGDVTSSTNQVANAFDALGKGETKALDDGFGFLSEATRGAIVELVKLGLNAEAQRAFLDALALTTNGSDGSVSSAFGELKSATTDLVSAWLSSQPAIQAVQGWLKGLARDALDATLEIRRATYAAAQGPDPSVVQFGLKSKIDQLKSEAAGQTGYRARATLDRARTYQSQLDGSRNTERRGAAENAARVFGGADGVVGKAGGRFGNAGLNVMFRKLDVTNAQEITVQAGASAKHLGVGAGHAQRLGDGLAASNRAARALESDLASVLRQFDPLETAARAYADVLKTISLLEKKGKITGEQASDFRIQAGLAQLEAEKRANDARLDKSPLSFSQIDSGNFEREMDRISDDVGQQLSEKFGAAGRKGGEALRDSGLDAAEAIAQILGGKIGGVVGKIIGLLKGAQTGDFSGVGGRAGGVLSLVAQQGKPSDGSFGGGILTGFQDETRVLIDGLKDLFGGIFGRGGVFTKELGEKIGAIGAAASLGAAAGNAVLGSKGSSLGGAIGGVLGKEAGKALGKIVGGTIGKALGPIGTILGGVLGSAIGGLLKKAPSGSVVITSASGANKTSGTLGQQLSGTGSNVQATINKIMEQLGGSAGDFAVSIGKYKDFFRVSATGSSTVGNRHGGPVIYNGKDEAAATAAAVLNALQDGAVTGLSAKVSKALQSSTDLDQALSDALKVQSLEDLLAGFGGSARKVFVDFERQAKERARIAGKYGFDMIEVERETGKQRATILAESISSATGGLKQLLEQLTSGDKSAGTLSDRRTALLAQAEALRPQAATNADAAAKLADVLDQLYQVSLDANGSAGAQFAGDRNTIRTTAETIIAQATAEITAVQDKARAIAGTEQVTTAALITQSNTTLSTMQTLLNEANGQNARMIAIMSAIEAAAASGQPSPFLGNYSAGLMIGREVAR